MVIRRVLAGFWILTLVIAMLGMLSGDRRGILYAWVQAFVLMFITAAAAKTDRDEELVSPLAYRASAIALLAVAVAGGMFGAVPGASGLSRLLAPFFAIVAILGFRAVVARGPRAALWALAIGHCTWVPFVLVTLVGCRRRHGVPEPHWTEIASTSALEVTLCLLAFVVAVALVSFRRRTVAEARLV